LELLFTIEFETALGFHPASFGFLSGNKGEGMKGRKDTRKTIFPRVKTAGG
jgi:hypothetical protein